MQPRDARAVLAPSTVPAASTGPPSLVIPPPQHPACHLAARVHAVGGALPASKQALVVGPGAARGVALLAVLDPAGCSPAVGGRGSSRVWLEVRAPGGARQGREEVSLGLLSRGRYRGWLEGAVGWKKSVHESAYSQVNTLVNTSWYYPVLLAALIGLFYSDLNRPRRRITTGSTDFLPSLPRAARRALTRATTTPVTAAAQPGVEPWLSPSLPRW